MSTASAQKVNNLVERLVKKINEQQPETITDDGKAQLRTLLINAKITNEEIGDLQKKAAVEGMDFRPFVCELIKKLSGESADDKTAALLNKLTYSGDTSTSPIEEVEDPPTIGSLTDDAETNEDHYARIHTLMSKHASGEITIEERDELQKRIAASGVFRHEPSEEPKAKEPAQNLYEDLADVLTQPFKNITKEKHCMKRTKKKVPLKNRKPGYFLKDLEKFFGPGTELPAISTCRKKKS